MPAAEPAPENVPTPTAPPSASAAPTLSTSPRLPPWQRVLLGVVALLPAVIAVAQLGRIHPDEVYQVLEPAWHRVHGYGVQAWEWRDGLRNWAVPLVASWVLRLAALLGITHPVAYRALLAVPQAALHGWMLWAVFRFASRRVGREAAVLATVLVGLYGPVLAFAGRTLGESFSAALLTVGLEALDRTERPSRSGALGGLALGLAVVTRYGSAVFVLAALVWLVAGRRWRQLAFCCLAGGAVALGLGALDWATWGAPFHSFVAYVRFNVLSGGAAAEFGSSPPGFYVPFVLAALPLWLWAATVWWGLGLRLRLAAILLGVFAVTFFLAGRFLEGPQERLLCAVLVLTPLALPVRQGGSLPLFCAAVYLAAVSATAHKEERFLYPALVLALVAVAPRVAGFILSAARPAGRGALALLALAATVLPLKDFPSGDLRGDQFRALVAATRDEGARGLLIVNEGLWGAGGYFYLGKNLPWRTCDWPHDAAFRASVADPRFNRAVTFEGRALAELQAAGFRVAGQVGRETILVRD
ncbi:glycosyltransferase family 39 protein [Myxococcaceae bacterium GXIMD 01537]